MAGNPLAKLLPYIKKYAMELYIGAGVFAYVMRMRSNNYTYAFVYSRNDFERRKALDNFKDFLSHH